VSGCDLETSKRRQPRPDLGCCATGKENVKSESVICIRHEVHVKGLFETRCDNILFNSPFRSPVQVFTSETSWKSRLQERTK
jgi:hypothetical protein